MLNKGISRHGIQAVSGLLLPRSTREQQRGERHEKLRCVEESNVSTFKVVDKLRAQSPIVKVIVSIERNTGVIFSAVHCRVSQCLLTEYADKLDTQTLFQAQDCQSVLRGPLCP